MPSPPSAPPQAPHFAGFLRVAGDDAGFGQGDPAAAAIAAAGLRQEVAHEELGALHHRVGEARVVLAAERGQDARHQRGVDLGERGDDGGVVARGVGRGGIERLPHGILGGRLGDRGKAADLQVEVHVLGVIPQARLQERRRQAGVEPAEGAGHAGRRIQDRVSRARGISARRREDRYAAAGDRRGACHGELAALAVGRHVDGEAAARSEGEVAVDRQRAQLVVAGPDRAEHGGGGQHAGAANGSGRADGEAARGDERAIGQQRPARDRGRAGVGRGAGDRERAGADLFQRAIAGEPDRVGIRIVVGGAVDQLGGAGEIGRDVIQQKGAAPEGADRQDVVQRVVGQLADDGVGNAVAEAAPVHQLIGRRAVGDGERAGRPGDGRQGAHQQRIDAIVGDELDRGRPREVEGRQVLAEVGEGRVRRGVDVGPELGAVGDVVAGGVPIIEHHGGRRIAAIVGQARERRRVVGQQEPVVADGVVGSAGRERRSDEQGVDVVLRAVGQGGGRRELAGGADDRAEIGQRGRVDRAAGRRSSCRHSWSRWPAGWDRCD